MEGTALQNGIAYLAFPCISVHFYDQTAKSQHRSTAVSRRIKFLQRLLQRRLRQCAADLASRGAHHALLDHLHQG